VVVVAVVLVLLPMVAAWIVDHGHGYSPLGDEALIDLHVRDLLAGHLPTLGPWSRYGWNHPGPALYYLLAPFSLLSGKAGWGTMAGGAALQALAVIGIAWVAWRRGGWKLSLATMVMVAVMYSTKAVAVVLDPWNPYVVFPFVALLAFAVWASISGDPLQMVTAVFAGSFLVQSHIGYAPFVVVSVLVVAVMLTVDLRHGRLPRARWGRIGAGAVVVGGLMWLPPIVQQFTGEHGNLSAIADYFTSGSTHGMGLSDGFHYYASNFSFPPPWLLPQHRDAVFLHQASLAWLIVPVVLVVAGLWAARRTGSSGDARLVAVAGLFALTGALAYSGIEPPPWQYLAMWRIPVAVLVWFASLWAIARWAWRSTSWQWTRRTSAVLVCASFVVITWGAGGYALRVLDHGKPVVNWDTSPVLLADHILRDGKPAGSVLVWQVGGGLSGLDVGLVDELDRRGVDVHLDDRGVTAEVDRRVASQRDVDQVWYMVTEPWVSNYSSRAGATVLARLTPLDPARDRELGALQRWLLDELHEHGKDDLEWLAESDLVSPQLVGIPGIDEQKVHRLAMLNHEVIHSSRCRCAVVSMPASTANP
jgi:hypothetical protein